jgi:hypothetical protein
MPIAQAMGIGQGSQKILCGCGFALAFALFCAGFCAFLRWLLRF